jgi:hypothetical protein
MKGNKWAWKKVPLKMKVQHTLYKGVFIIFAGPSWWTALEEQSYLGIPWGLKPTGWIPWPTHRMMMVAFGGLRDTLEYLP